MSSSPVSEGYELAVADTVEAIAEVYEAIELHPNGNAVFIVKGSSTSLGRRFTVSSDTLGLASSYFRTMFSSSFKEGVETRGGLCPDIHLEEDDPEAMEILLSLLHFNIQDKYTELEPRMITMVAQQSDKYECNKAMTPWVLKWLGNVQADLGPEDYGLLLTAAYLFDVPDLFRFISAMAIRHTSPEGLKVWRQHSLISLLPKKVRKPIVENIISLNEYISDELILVQKQLEESSNVHEKLNNICKICGAPVDRGNTFHCNSYNSTWVSLCSNETRVGAHFRALRKHSLWISLVKFKTKTGSELIKAFQAVRDDQSYYDCMGGSECPLTLETIAALQKITGVFDNIKGTVILSRAVRLNERQISNLSLVE